MICCDSGAGNAACLGILGQTFVDLTVSMLSILKDANESSATIPATEIAYQGFLFPFYRVILTVLALPFFLI